jgi:hypothetical protein
MLGVNQLDFMSYTAALKSNYRKGIRRMEAILANPTHAKEFAANLGGVSVVLGVPIELPDRNSDKLLELLLGSTVADDAVLTWMHQFYEFTDWDDLLSDSARCKEMANNPLIWRAAGGSKLAVGKSVATLAGLSCSAYKDIDAVAASSTAMAAIIANATALNAVVTSSTAMAAVAASSTAMAAIIANATALNAVVTSSTAMAAVVNSTTACRAIESSATAIAAMNAASGFVEVTNQVCQANSSMSVALINKKAWVSQYWNTSSDTNTSQSMLIGVNVVGGGSTNIGNFSVARTRKSVNKFVSSIRIATTYGSTLSYGGIRYKPLS